MKSLIHRICLAAALASGAAAAGAEGSPADDRAAPAAHAAMPGSVPGAVPGPRGRIKHVVVIFQENRTPDNLFHGLPGADIANEGVDSTGQVIPLMPGHLQTTYSLGHSHEQFVLQYDNGKMDGADKVTTKCNTPGPRCMPKHPQFMYVDPADVAPYLEMAQTYAFGDRMFQSNQGPTFPAHQFLIAGTSTPSAGGAYDAYFASGNPMSPRFPTGCVAGPPGQHVAIIDPQGVEDRKGVFPCFEHRTMMDLLEDAGHSWSYYVGRPYGILAAPNAIQHIATGPGWNNVKTPPVQVLTDIAEGTLADVSWVMPLVLESDHPGQNDGSGPSWVASIVNAIGASAYWKDTAIFITWDDWGGWYDHVPPPIESSYEHGFRVPLVVVSPYARRGYVSHVTHTFGSLLKFMEVAYDLPSLGYEDARSDDLRDCFDYTQALRPFKPIAAEHDAAFLLRRAPTEPPIDADDE